MRQLLMSRKPSAQPNGQGFRKERKKTNTSGTQSDADEKKTGKDTPGTRVEPKFQILF